MRGSWKYESSMNRQGHAQTWPQKPELLSQNFRIAPRDANEDSCEMIWRERPLNLGVATGDILWHCLPPD